MKLKRQKVIFFCQRMHLKMHEGNYSGVCEVRNKNGKTYSKFEK